MATNPYSYGSLGQRWTVGEPTSKSLLDISRVKNDANRWTLEQLIPDPDTTQTLGFDLSFNSSDQRLLQIYNTDASNYFQIFGGQAATPTSDHLVFSTGTNGTIMAFDGLNHWITFHDTAGVQKMYYRGDGSPGLILEPGVGLIVGGTISGSTGAFSSTLAATGATTIGAGQAVNAKALLTLTSTTSAGYGGEIQFHKNSASTAEIGHESAVLGSGLSSDLFLASGGAIDFATGGTTQRMTILSDGKTGIGTASPAAELHVSGSSILGDNFFICDTVSFSNTTTASLDLSTVTTISGSQTQVIINVVYARSSTQGGASIIHGYKKQDNTWTFTTVSNVGGDTATASGSSNTVTVTFSTGGQYGNMTVQINKT